MFNSLTLGFAPLNDDLYRSRHVFFCILHDIIEGDVLKEWSSDFIKIRLGIDAQFLRPDIYKGC